MRAPGPELGAVGQPPAQLRLPHGAAPNLGRQTPWGSPQPHTRTPRGAAPQDQVRTAPGRPRAPTYAQPGGQPPTPYAHSLGQPPQTQLRTLPGTSPGLCPPLQGRGGRRVPPLRGRAQGPAVGQPLPPCPSTPPPCPHACASPPPAPTQPQDPCPRPPGLSPTAPAPPRSPPAQCLRINQPLGHPGVAACGGGPRGAPSPTVRIPSAHGPAAHIAFISLQIIKKIHGVRGGVAAPPAQAHTRGAVLPPLAAPSPTDVSLEPCRCRHPPCAWRAPWPHSSCGEGGTAPAAPPGAVCPPRGCVPPPQCSGGRGAHGEAQRHGQVVGARGQLGDEGDALHLLRGQQWMLGGGPAGPPSRAPPRHSPHAAAGCRGAAGTARSPRAAPARRHRPRGRAARWTGWGPPGTAAGPRAARASWGGTGVRGDPRVPQLECTGAQ